VAPKEKGTGDEEQKRESRDSGVAIYRISGERQHTESLLCSRPLNRSIRTSLQSKADEADPKSKCMHFLQYQNINYYSKKKAVVSSKKSGKQPESPRSRSMVNGVRNLWRKGFVEEIA